jgi:hypothetical protein
MHRHQHTRELITSQAPEQLAQQIAFHEAGHAIAIYLGNRLRKLPPVYFRIEINHSDNGTVNAARVIDGQLIQNLPMTLLDNLSDLSEDEKHSYQCAYEADVINLLAGPLAEARYVSIRDDEILNLNLLSTKALGHFYGGQSDLAKAYQYLECYIADPKKRESKMLELFAESWMFISQRQHWTAILNLANYILESKQSLLSCEDIPVALKNIA